MEKRTVDDPLASVGNEWKERKHSASAYIGNGIGPHVKENPKFHSHTPTMGRHLTY